MGELIRRKTPLNRWHELENAPQTAKQTASTARLHKGGCGWALILSDLKTLLETGSSFAG